MTKLNKTDFVIKAKRGLRADLEKVTNYFPQGEIIYTTDGKQFFIADGNYIPQPVQSLDMAVMVEDQIVSLDNEIVYNF